MRLFIALDPPANVRDAISDLQFPSDQIRWNNADQFHLTLAFLGEQADNQLDALCEQLAEIRFQPFELQTLDMGCFRHGALWLGFQSNPSLARLQKQLARSLHTIAIRLEHRRFHPHLTLGRSRSNPAPAVEHLQRQLNHQRFTFRVDRFLLKSSVLRQDGAVHQIEAEFLAD
mgnify:CR=1 FL=1|tara:strand:- start:82 stop:600 length:519 start_codon:yes stop_codon:yes gene_type:complete